MITHKARLSLIFDVHSLTNGNWAPTYDYAGKALKIVEGESLDDCVSQIKKLLRSNGFVLTGEQRCDTQKAD